MDHLKKSRKFPRVTLQLPDFEYQALRNAQLQSSLTKDYSKFANLKNFAIYQLGCKLLRAVQIVQDIFATDQHVYCACEVPRILFSWQPEDFLARRNMEIFWLNILQRYISNDCLEKKKFYYDLEILQNLMRIMIQGFVDNKQDLNILDELEKVYGHLIKVENLSDELRQNKNKYREEINENLANEFFHRSASLKRSRITYSMTRDYLQDSMEMRYKLGYQDAKVEQFKLDMTNREHDWQKQIELYKNKIIYENKCHQQSIRMCEEQTNQIRYQLYKVRAHMDDDTERLNSEMHVKRIDMKRMQDELNSYMDILAYYRQEKEQILQEREAELATEKRLKRERWLAERKLLQKSHQLPLRRSKTKGVKSTKK